MAVLVQMEPDRFQKLCQAILICEFPDVVCFPVGQADGGRDALRRDFSRGGMTVFQVKSARNPGLVKDPARWIIDAVAGEVDNIARLVDRGAAQYHILTNVGGSGRLDRGTIDRVSAFLEDKVPIPAVCWWADDIERRLEAYPHLSWQYPELLDGKDVLAKLFESDLSEHRRRREQAVRVSMSRESLNDSKLRFKQMDLHSPILELFVDVVATMRTARPD